MPVDHYFLFLAVEDVENHVFWGAHIAHLPSWQMKIYRRYENLAVRGGLADLKFGNWKKNVAPGERFHTSEAILPIAYTTAASSSWNRACARRTRAPPLSRTCPSSSMNTARSGACPRTRTSSRSWTPSVARASPTL